MKKLILSSALALSMLFASAQSAPSPVVKSNVKLQSSLPAPAVKATVKKDKAVPAPVVKKGKKTAKPSTKGVNKTKK